MAVQERHGASPSQLADLDVEGSIIKMDCNDETVRKDRQVVVTTGQPQGRMAQYQGNLYDMVLRIKI